MVPVPVAAGANATGVVVPSALPNAILLMQAVSAPCRVTFPFFPAIKVSVSVSFQLPTSDLWNVSVGPSNVLKPQ